MNRLRLLAGAIVFSALGLGVQQANAQALIPQYQPATPIMSPWLRLSNKNSGALDAYHNSVRPEMQLQQTLQQQSLTNQQQADRLSGLHGQVSDLENGGVMHATGTNSVFMNYSHYYGTDVRSPAGQTRPSPTSHGVRPTMPGSPR
jgi:hypothetical protein